MGKKNDFLKIKKKTPIGATWNFLNKVKGNKSMIQTNENTQANLAFGNYIYLFH
jgi:hypothetical protein